MLFVFYTMLFLLSYGLTAYFRSYALKIGCIDTPNHRSAHDVPTPRGGGLAFVLCFLLGLMIAFLGGYIAKSFIVTFLIAGGGVAGIGWLDDRFFMSAGLRLLGQVEVAFLTLWSLGIQETGCLGLNPEVSMVLGLFYLVWLTNLFNFMDGIDGLAVMETICVALGMSLLGTLYRYQDMGVVLGGLIAAVLGFGIWNFPKARIFMGDVGSGFLGMTLGVVSLIFARENATLFWGSIMLMGVFVVDASLTLFIRALKRERIWEAHCQHAYQHVSRRVGSHVPVTLGVVLINMLWLLPVAVMTVLGVCSVRVGIVLAYLPLLGLVWKLKNA